MLLPLGKECAACDLQAHEDNHAFKGMWWSEEMVYRR